MENNIATFKNVLSDIKTIITSARNTAYSSTNQIMIMAYYAQHNIEKDKQS